MSDIKERLTKDIATIDWRDVLPHAKRDMVIVVDAGLDLVAVGEAIAKDNASLVSLWIQQKQITKPSADQLSQWNSNPEKQFITLIVQPFVIVQESSSDKPSDL